MLAVSKDKIIETLQARPLIGLFSTATGSFMPMIEEVTPMLQFLGLVIGVGIGVLTLYCKVLDIVRKNKQIKKLR